MGNYILFRFYGSLTDSVLLVSNRCLCYTARKEFTGIVKNVNAIKAIGQKMTVYIICRRMFNVYVRFTQLPKPEHTTAIMSPHSLAPHTSIDKTLTFLFELFHLLINISLRYDYFSDIRCKQTLEISII